MTAIQSNKLLVNSLILLIIFGNGFSSIVAYITLTPSFTYNAVIKSIILLIAFYLIIYYFYLLKIDFHKFLVVSLFASSFTMAFVRLIFFNQAEYNTVYYLTYGFFAMCIPLVALALIEEGLGDLRKIVQKILFIFCLFTFITGNKYEINLNYEYLEYTGKLNLPGFNPIVISLFGCFLILIAFWGLIIEKKYLIFHLVCIVVGGSVMFGGLSRGPFLGLLFSILFVLKFKYLKFLIPISFVLLIINFDNVLKLKHYFLASNYQSNSDRLYIYGEYLSAVRANIFLPNVNPILSLEHSHNIFLAVYSSASIFGLFLFLYLNIKALLVTRRLICTFSSNAWIGIFFINVLVVSFFSGALLDYYYWFFLMLVFMANRKIKFNS